MVLENLYSKIESLNSKINSFRTTLEVNETRTRVALIDPLLHELGWDVANPARVIAEYSVGLGGVADYALIDNNNRPIAILEAKRLGSNLSTHKMQIVQYAVASGIKFAGLTDGDNWEIYDVFKQVEFEQKRILQLSISRSPVHECALKLLLLWHPNLESGQPTSSFPPIITADNESPPEPKEPIETKKNWINLMDYNPPVNSKPPLAIEFWDGTQKPIGKWHELLTFVVEKLYSENLINDNHIPIGFSSKTFVVNSEPKHQTGNSFASYKQIGDKALYVNTNLNAGQIRSNTRNIFKKFAPNGSNLYVKLSQNPMGD